MNKPVLVVMAAGMGSRYGGMKQIDPVGPNGQVIVDYSLYDARRAGFETVIFVIKHEIEDAFKAAIGDRVSKAMNVKYAFQQLEELPAGYTVPEGRVKPWGTCHAVLAAKDLIDGPFAVINADDYYGPEAFRVMYDYLSTHEDGSYYDYCMVSYLLRNTVSEKQVVVDDEHVAAGVGLAGGLAVLAVVHEELADGGTGHRRDVLHRGGIGSGGRNDDGVVERTVLSEGLADVGNRGGLLADGDIDADHALAALVEDSVDGDGGLTGLTVADDELTLTAANRHHGVDSEQTGLNRLAHRGTIDDAGSLEFDGATVRGDDVAQAVDGLAERIDDAAEHGTAHGDIHNAASGAALVAFLDGVDGTEQNGADLVTVKVLGKAEDGLTGIGALELQKLACHGALEAGDARDAVAYLVDR